MTRGPRRPTNGRQKGGKGQGAKRVAGRTAKPGSKSNTFVHRPKPGQTQATAAEMMVAGLGTNAVAAKGYSKMLGRLDLAECMAALVAASRKVQDGNLAGLEATLTAQTVTLNAMFTQLACEASKMTIVDQIDRFTRLALKAQAQCRATGETLAVLKNPPVFARQANIAAGPQQVNNGPVAYGTPAHAGVPESAPNKLLEAHDERLELGTPAATSASNQAMATVGTRNRPPHHRGKGAGLSHRVSRR